jgi:uncharacterized protein
MIRREDIVFEHEDDGTLGAFYLVHDGRRVGRLTYARLGEAEYVLDYIEVAPSLRGQGLAHELIADFADFVRDKGARIRARCPVARGMMQVDPAYEDVLINRL